MSTYTVFMEGTQEQSPDRQYSTLVDFPVPVKAGNGVYLKRVRMVLDVTGMGLPTDADQEEFEDWLESDSYRYDGFLRALMAEARSLAASEKFQAEASVWIGGLGRSIL